MEKGDSDGRGAFRESARARRASNESRSRFPEAKGDDLSDAFAGKRLHGVCDGAMGKAWGESQSGKYPGKALGTKWKSERERIGDHLLDQYSGFILSLPTNVGEGSGRNHRHAGEVSGESDAHPTPRSTNLKKPSSWMD